MGLQCCLVGSFAVKRLYIRGTVAIHLLGDIHFWFGYITDTSTSDSKNTEVMRSV